MIANGWVINLDRRPDRWAHWQTQVPRCPFPVTRMAGVDVAEVPHTFAASTGAFGCAASHYQVLTAALGKSGPVAVFEDDAVLPENFDQLLADTLANLPDDWETLVLASPDCRSDPVSEWVARARVFRWSVAYLVRNSGVLTALAAAARARTHWDIGWASAACYRRTTYVPVGWSVGHARLGSDIW